MYSMFSHCKSLISLNLSSFDTSKVTEMWYMFNNCDNLQYLDISNFSPLNITTIEKIFKNMASLIFLNIYSFEINNKTNLSNSFALLKNNCANEYNMKNYLLSLNLSNNCSDICFKKNIKIDIIDKECINSCKDNNYKYECNNICYNECPNGSHIIIKDIKNKDNIFIEFEDGVAICLDRNPEGYYLDKDDGFYKICFETCKFCYGLEILKIIIVKNINTILYSWLIHPIK